MGVNSERYKILIDVQKRLANAKSCPFISGNSMMQEIPCPVCGDTAENLMNNNCNDPGNIIHKMIITEIAS